ncbi:Phospholipid-transporting ATPase [Mycena indigotica]|uniref:Phospholipid-transporting ATPase n=1 Tax=Mycena indigotica TaxID=2126181 RepID=A0A8H6W172_9AGAR|nr:Phospholipid-transporting ATPase [Mycena indigotica]KAF7295629.1 Phospholipid-transporting ATPase [Mycena indigotica]
MPRKKSAFVRVYEKVVSFNVGTLFSRRRQPGPKRTVCVNQPLPPSYLDPKGKVKAEHFYVSNQVITSKYTLVTFLPRNLLEQFRRVANVFFLVIAILQFFPKFSTISPGLVIFPLLVVIGFTAGKDAYEDTKRHQSDRKVNHSSVRILPLHNTNPMKAKSRTFVRGVKNLVWRKGRGEAKEGEEDGWQSRPWEDVRVGDIVKIVDNEPLPADILICATSEDDNVAFVETKNLDGETNLKSRHASPSLTHLNSAAAFADAEKASFHVDCERPDTNMYRLNGAVFVGNDNTSAPFDLTMTLLRGTVLRNTDWVIGVVLYTGEDTKIILNSGGTPSKRSKVERQMNPQVASNLLILAAMAVACGISDSVLEKRYYPQGALWLYGDNTSSDNPSYNGLVTWAFALITFQNIVPISLYISIEFVRTCQALFIYFDSEIYYAKTNQATLARSWNLADDLGQIEYIFSDKTGTLTQNSMVFRECSIGGKRYTGETQESEIPPAPPANAGDRPSTGDSSTAVGSAPATDQGTPPRATSPTGKNARKPRFSDSVLTADLSAAQHAGPNTPDAAHARSLNGFFIVLALCHTVLADIRTENGREEVNYKAQSPDEAALVQAAADAGYEFRGREQRNGVLILTLKTPFGGEERYELLNVLEFTSARKRMSVIVKKLGSGADEETDGKLLLLSKGADNVIFDRLKKGVAEDLKAQTEDHLDEFASNGLRTLTLAYKVLSDNEYEAWNQRYHDATVTLDEQIIEDVSDEIEHDLRLLGATAIEDRLQDGVPETIADLKRAGIKVWVATGDKLETAIAIGHSTNLIGKDSNIIVIRDGDEGSRPVYDQLTRAIEEFFPESGLLPKSEETNSRPTHHRRASSSSARSRRRASGSQRSIPLGRVNTGVSSIVGADNGDRPGGFILVIDGTALGHAFSDDRNKETLLDLAMLCEGVICCRVSPLQKALVVHLVKDGIGAMTLAIGDGANDVSMIQAADVGVGISGEEGLQAVNSSDYAIAQFRFLKRLVLVHGHWSYARNGNMILNFFFKNIVCIGVLWWFQIYNGWSSSYVFEYTYLLWWNAFWTIAPVIAIGVFDRLIDADTLMALPELYHFGREGRWFGFKLFIVYMLDGVVQSAIIFFIIRYTYATTTARSDGYNVYQYEFATTMAMTAILCANLFNGLNTNFWTGWVFFAVFLGIVLSWGYTSIYSIISPGWISTPVFGNVHYLFHSAYYWLCILFCVPVALLPRYISRAWAMGFDPNDIDLLRAVRKIEPHVDIAAAAAEAGKGKVQPSLAALKRARSSETATSAPRRSGEWHLGSRTDMATGLRSLHRGFDFSAEEGGVAMRRIQTGLSEARQSRVSLPGGKERRSFFSRKKKGEQ